MYIHALQVRSRLNGQILELMAADVTECLPRYCLPSVIARVKAEKVLRCWCCCCCVVAVVAVALLFLLLLLLLLVVTVVVVLYDC